MPAHPSASDPSDEYTSFDYAIVRVVPCVVRAEFINVGVILFCRTKRYLDAKIELDRERLAAIAPAGFDVDQAEKTLALIPAIARGAGPIGALPLSDRFHWLTAPRSTVIQVSPVHCGRCTDPQTTLERLMDSMVRKR